MYESYNASYPLEYYSVGDVYSFCVGVDRLSVRKDGKAAKPYSFAGTVDYPTADEIKKYAKQLKNVDGASAASASDSIGVLCGVIVSKIKGDGKHAMNDGKTSVDKLKVMFANENAECGYVVKYYAVDYMSVMGDGVTHCVAASSVDRDFSYREVKLLADVNTVVDGAGKIDHETGEMITSGITAAESTVSGITAADDGSKKKSTKKSGVTAAETVSGITAAENVSGITDAE